MLPEKNLKFYAGFLPLCAVYFLLPYFAAAASIRVIFAKGTDIMLQIIQVLWLVASAVFILGVIRFISSANNPEKRKSAKNFLIYGLVGFFVLLSFWGLIRILQNTFFGGEVSSSYSGFSPDPSYYQFRDQEGLYSREKPEGVSDESWYGPGGRDQSFPDTSSGNSSINSSDSSLYGD